VADLTRAKLHQAASLLEKHGLDCWIIQFARETGLRPDPLAYLIGASITWPSAFLLNRDGRTVAIVGTGDSGQIQGLGLWDEVRPYVASPREGLVKLLESWDPKTIGVTWSESDDTSDAITFGMYRVLESLLEGTPYRERLVTAGALAGEVRSRKLPDEIEAIHSAIAFTEQLFKKIEAQLKPGMTELQMQKMVQDWVHEAGFGFSWEEKFNPMVDFGPRPGPLGHTPPGNIKLEPGQLIHVDLGILRDGFASDLQRTWYWLRGGESQAPEPVRRAFDATRASLDAGMKTLKPGNAGYQVDAESRRTVIEAGFPEPGFAFGHHVGRVAHDGAGVLGPRWERYGKAPEVVIQPGNVFAVEMDLEVPGYGLMGLEEEAVVEEEGARFLSTPQRELWLLNR
jgi:Xaa-Pro aminopeptidase